jgi:hypothetical protein
LAQLLSKRNDENITSSLCCLIAVTSTHPRDTHHKNSNRIFSIVVAGKPTPATLNKWVAIGKQYNENQLNT